MRTNANVDLEELVELVVQKVQAKLSAGDVTQVTVDLAQAGLTRLTPREHQIVLLLGQGKSNKIIASELGITLGATKTYIYRLMSKTKKTRFELALFGYGLAQRMQSGDGQRPN